MIVHLYSKQVNKIVYHVYCWLIFLFIDQCTCESCLTSTKCPSTACPTPNPPTSVCSCQTTETGKQSTTNYIYIIYVQNNRYKSLNKHCWSNPKSWLLDLVSMYGNPCFIIRDMKMAWKSNQKTQTALIYIRFTFFIIIFFAFATTSISILKFFQRHFYLHVKHWEKNNKNMIFIKFFQWLKTI